MNLPGMAGWQFLGLIKAEQFLEPDLALKFVVCYILFEIYLFLQ